MPASSCTLPVNAASLRTCRGSAPASSRAPAKEPEGRAFCDTERRRSASTPLCNARRPLFGGRRRLARPGGSPPRLLRALLHPGAMAVRLRRECARGFIGGLVWVHMKRGAVDLTFPPSAAAISSRNRTRSVAVAFGAPSAAKGPPADPRAHSCHAALLDVAASPRASLACACLCPPSLPGGRRCSTLCTGILQRCLLRRGRTWPHILPVQRVRAGGQRPTPHGGRMARFRARHVDRRVRISTHRSNKTFISVL